MTMATVITTINKPEMELINSLNLSHPNPKNVIVVGDEKTPNSWSDTAYMYLSLEKQSNLFGEFSKSLSVNHYSRKNIGYFCAINETHVDWIFDTDDDNFLLQRLKAPQINDSKLSFVSNSELWVNPYPIFREDTFNNSIWPRGLPITRLHREEAFTQNSDVKNDSPLILSVVNGNPDVDAIHRLVFKDSEIINFKSNVELYLKPYQITPINSQATWWHKSLFRLMYLPSHCTFRVTDILRGYVTFAVLKHRNLSMKVVSPLVFQNRNAHDLLRDFIDETPLYEKSEDFINQVLSIEFDKDASITEIMRKIYSLAIRVGLTKEQEIYTLNEWLKVSDLLKLEN